MSITIVTGIWDIKRNELSQGWNRSFDHYLNHLKNLMKTDMNMIIYVEEKHRKFVEEYRKKENTYIIVRELDWFRQNSDIFNKIQKIRLTPEWYNQAPWLSESTQAKLEMYNPLVMSKMFLLNDASILDPFDSSHLIWVDGALTNTVHEGYFWKDKVIEKIHLYFNKFSFVCFPYNGKVEIHGFKYDKICKYTNAEVDKVARGGIFGGPKHVINQINNIYYSLLYDTLSEGLMGTEESIFTIMVYNYPDIVQYYKINEDGLLGTFFENLKNDTLDIKVEKKESLIQKKYNINNVALYVLTYNSPNQFKTLCESFKLYDSNFIDIPKKFLINNSINHDFYNEYDTICEEYGFTHIKMEKNTGICGGRQFAAEHSNDNDFDFHFFFEDDMNFYLGNDEFCKNGFRRKIKDFFNILMEIEIKEDFDFLKWNFTEFFGDNSLQWAWHNLPADARKKLFPENPVKNGNDIHQAPNTKFKHIKSLRGVPYASGEIFYCNWPQVVSKEGNRKLFLNTKWEYKYEQTWMSYIYQETVKGNIKPGILLATPTEHYRFEHYPSSERREH